MTDYSDNLFRDAPVLGFVKARELRRKMTEEESMLWKFLRNKNLPGYKFR
ncbi:MAG: DUF559 domain-containing protein [Bacteroidia bacterium]|nr:DUF559 domain-containing protein [Bacteroidia bacterium]